MHEIYHKLSGLLSPLERRQALVLLALMLLVGVVEVVGIASIFPLIAVLSNPGMVHSNEYLHLVYTTLGFTDIHSFLIFLSVSVFLVVVGRTALTALSSYAVLRFIYMRGHTLSVRLLERYLQRKYSWFLNNHSADLSKSLFSEIDEVIVSGLLPGLQLLAQSIVAICILGFVVAVDPIVALIATATVAGAYGLFYVVIRKMLQRVGRDRRLANSERIRVAQEVIGGIKEVKVGGLEQGYLRRFSAASLRFGKLRTRLQVLGEQPRHFLEMVAIGGMLIVIMTLLFRNQGNLAEALPVIALYAFAGMRLLPVIQVLYKALVNMRAAGPIVDALHSEFVKNVAGPALTTPPPMALASAIKLKNVSFTYPHAERLSLRDVTLTIPVHATVGFVGRTGAGKSTIVDLILGLLEPQQGQLLVDDVPIGPDNVRAWQRAVGYVPQHIFLADESIAANIGFGLPRDKIDMVAVERAARMASLHDFVVGELPQGYHTQVGERGVRLSGGQRQRVGIARALYNDPSVLILDEATSALDNLTEQTVMEAVRSLARRKTIILIAHRLTTVQVCERIFVLDGGRLIEQGNWDELIRRPGRLAEMAGTDAA